MEYTPLSIALIGIIINMVADEANYLAHNDPNTAPLVVVIIEF